MPEDIKKRLQLLEDSINAVRKLQCHRQQALTQSHNALSKHTSKKAVICNVKKNCNKVTVENNSVKWVQPYCSNKKNSNISSKTTEQELCTTKYEFYENSIDNVTKSKGYEIIENQNKIINKKLSEEKDKLDQAYRLIEQLTTELETLKKSHFVVTKDKRLLLNACKLLRQKYKQLKVSEEQSTLDAQQLKALNSELCRKLDEQLKQHRENMKILKANAAKELQTKLKEKIAEIEQTNKEHHRKLLEANETLAKNTCEICRKLDAAEDQIKSLKGQLDEKSKKFESNIDEISKLKSQLEHEKSEKTGLNQEMSKLQKHIKELLEEQDLYKDEIITLKSKINDLENSKNEMEQENRNKLQEYEEMEKECRALRAKTSRDSEAYEKRIMQIEQEMHDLLKTMKEREKVLNRDNEALTKLVQELSDVIQSHKTRISDLININNQQEKLLQSQMVVLQNKEEQIQLAELESRSLQDRSKNLESELEKLRNLLENHKKLRVNCNCEEELNKLKDELRQTKLALEEERDKLLIKEKIVEDQADTIQNLKSKMGTKGNEIKKYNEEFSRLQKQLEKEKKSKDKMACNIRELERHSEKLKLQIEDLTQRLESSSSSDENVSSNSKLLESLQIQIDMKKRQWDLQCEILTKEKERAVQAARFATQKLLDTVTDFRTQAENQKRVHELLAYIVQDQSQGKGKKQICGCDC